MLIRTPRDLGAAMRDYRRRRGLDQAALAAQIGVSRQWVVAVEKGKTRAQLGLVLRAFNALGATLSLDEDVSPHDTADDPGEVDIHRIIDDARKPNP
jgi:HTH-type transcriptional regulator/antitoxin HipB